MTSAQEQTPQLDRNANANSCLAMAVPELEEVPMAPAGEVLGCTTGSACDRRTLQPYRKHVALVQADSDECMIE